MLYKNIMVAYDGSEPSTEALVVAKDMIGEDADATMHIVSIIPIGAAGIGLESPIQPVSGMSQVYTDMDTFNTLLDKAKADTISSIHDAVDDMLDGVKCKVEAVAYAAAKPSYGIVEYASEKSVDMIVMGRRGLGALRAMLGSVSYAVLHECDIPVVTVK
ncbi:MAG: universal stress protein [Eggerthellaceae bacterium]|nr:universal stress protein [Eggerthellaceae bacterium]